MAHKNKKFPDEVVLLVARNAPAGRSPAKFAAEILECGETLVYRCLLKDRDPETFARLYTRQNISRRRPVTPTVEQIEVALKLSHDNACAAARILGCSKTPVRAFINQERAEGRTAGNYRIKGVQISRPLPDNAPSRPEWMPSPEFLAEMQKLADDVGVEL